MKVLIATDGSEVAQHAAQQAGALLALPDQVIVLAVLTDVPGSDAGGIEGSVETPDEAQKEWNDEQRAAAGAVDATVAALPEAWQPHVVRRVEAGDAGAMVVWVAEHEDVDVVVMGSHGRRALKRILMGSVSEHVVRHAPCPTLVIRAGAEHLTD